MITPTGTDIGDPVREWEAEPLEEPVPQRGDPARVPEQQPGPVRPPVRTPEPVPV